MEIDNLTFKHVDSLSHEGTVVVFGETWPEAGASEPSKLWYRVLDLAPTTDQDQPGSWEDATRWTRWFEVPFPPELRAAGMSLLTIRQAVNHGYARAPGCWQVLSSGGFIYLFRALDLLPPEKQGVHSWRVYANRFTLPREISPDGGNSKGTSGEAITVPQLRPAREARYRRSGQRETPQSSIDSQGTRDMTGDAFVEPTLEFSMLRPLNGFFTVTLTPSNVPGRDRWQFFCKETFQPEPEPDAEADAPLPPRRPAIGCYSLLRDDDGWVDLTDKFDLLNTRDDPFSILPDVAAVLVHPTLGDLELASRPDALTFRLQEQAGGLNDNEERAVSPERVMISALVSWQPGSPQEKGLVAVDFPLVTTEIVQTRGDTAEVRTIIGAIEVGTEVRVDDVRFARTALSLNAPSDRVVLPLPLERLENVTRASDFTVQAWVRHDAGSGLLLWQNLDNSEALGEDSWWAIRWDAVRRQLIALYQATQTRLVEIRVSAPVSFTWHHMALVKRGGSLELYVNAERVGRSDDAESASTTAVTGPVMLGGPLGPDDDSWLDYRIDQITLYDRAEIPSLDTIYLELSQNQQEADSVLGHWTFDDATADELLQSGADLVTQTAPIFAPEPLDFEATLGGQSTGMGLLRIPDVALVADAGPNLFRGADGLVRVYLAAKFGADSEATAGTLVYDTTSTRAQFTFGWVATSEAGDRSGSVILQGRYPGPILNRAQLSLAAGSQAGTLNLTITHPHVPHFREEWRGLPGNLADFITVLNGGASDEPDADDVLNGNLPFYAYGAKGPYGDRQGAYASKLFQAIAASAPANGGTPLLTPDQTARLRQQGNFTGWTRAPLAVSGRFGAHAIPDVDGEVAVMATVPSVLDDPLALRAPGDFAVELWANPGASTDRQTLVSWHQEQGDGMALEIEPVDGFAFSDRDGGHVVLAPSLQDLIRDNITFESRFQIPSGGSGGTGGDLIVVETTDSWTVITGSAGDDGIVYELLRLRLDDITANDTLTLEARDERILEAEAWAETMASSDPVTVSGRTIIALKVQGRRIQVTTTQQLDAAPEGSLADLWLRLVKGEQVTVTMPGESSWSVQRDLDVNDDGQDDYVPEPVDVEVVLLDTKLEESDGTYVTVNVSIDLRDDARPGVSHIDMQRTLSSVVCTVNDVELARTEGSSPWIRASSGADARILLGTADSNDAPFTGTIERAIVRSAGITLVDASPTRSSGGAQVRVNSDISSGSTDVTIPDAVLDNLESGFNVATSLGDRAYRTPAPISASDWLHLALVCSDNIAIRCTQDGDRAVIKDADSLNPNKELTLDCILVRDDNAKERWLFSKTNLAGDAQDISFALGITADGHPHFRYTLEVKDDYQVYDLFGSQRLDIGKPYHVFVSVKLAEYTVPESLSFEVSANDDGAARPPARREPRFQVWMQHARIAVWDITSANWIGGAPQNFPTSFAEAAGRDVSEARGVLQTVSSDNIFLRTISGSLLNAFAASRPLVSLPSGNRLDWTLLLAISVEDKATQAVTFRNILGPAAIAAYSGEDPAILEGQDLGFFRGVIGHVRVWTRALSAADFKLLAQQPGLPSGMDKPSAWWQLNENRGLQAQDSQGGAAARLNREQLWTFARETARLSLYLNGRIKTLQPASHRPSYGNPGELRFGGSDGGSEIFQGRLDELRLWSDIRSNEEILDSMHLRLSGKEDDLLGYWPISARSGPLIKDEAPGAHHAQLSETSLPVLRAFWSTQENAGNVQQGAPVSDDLPQVRHLLGGQNTSFTASFVASASTAAEYSEIQVSPEGQLVGVFKRAIAWARDQGDAGFGTGFKIGDAELTYIGQAQSDPTLIGFIEGAPPVPSENLTRAYWSSATTYSGYSGNTAVTLQEAENTTLTFASSTDRGSDFSFDEKFGPMIKGQVKIAVGFSFGAHTDTGVPLAEFEVHPVGIRGTREDSNSTLTSYEVGIGTTRTLTNTFGLGGSWEAADFVLNPTVGRRYVPDNIGYALVKSGVANVFAMRLRSNGAMLGIQMIPDPDIPEDFNIITFKIRDDYTRQGSLDGKVGFVNDPAYPNADQARGSYFRPLEVANLEAQIEAYETRLAANYDSFNSMSLGQETVSDGRAVVENNLEIPYDWESNLSKRNIVNTYVWTATGGFFEEELNTSITRTESLGGSFSTKRLLGVVSDGSIVIGGVGLFWDLSAMWGSHIENSVTKTRSEGRDFGLSVDVTCDDLLEVYTGDPRQTYSGEAAPGKVNGYRFKSFYLVPSKDHFSSFWDTVIDPDWLESADNDARALRQAKGNLNQVWRVFHRVTYVSRVPPRGGKSLGDKGESARSVVHEVPNWQVVNLVLDVIRTGVDSRGNEIGISHPLTGAAVERQYIALAVDDVVTYQWPSNAPAWQQALLAAHPGSPEDIFDQLIDADGIEADTTGADGDADNTEVVLATLDPDTDAGRTFQQLRQDVYDYMVAYFETGLADKNPRLFEGPAGPDITEPEEPEEPPLPPLDTLEEGAEEAIHLYLLSPVWDHQDSRGQDHFSYSLSVVLDHRQLPPAVQGRLTIPGATSTTPPGRVQLAMSADWGRLGDRTTEIVFRQTRSGRTVLMAPSGFLSDAQKPFHWIAIDNERGDNSLAIRPVGSQASVSLPGVDSRDSVGKLVYLALSFTHSRPVDEEADTPATPAQLVVRWSVEGENRIRSQSLTALDGDSAGGYIVLGGDGEDLDLGSSLFVATGGFELYHLALHAVALDTAEVDRRARALGLIQ